MKLYLVFEEYDKRVETYVTLRGVYSSREIAEAEVTALENEPYNIGERYYIEETELDQRFE